MPIATTTFLYGLSILAGIIFVAYGVRPRQQGKKAFKDSCRCPFPDELANPTSEVLPLRFSDDPKATGVELTPKTRSVTEDGDQASSEGPIPRDIIDRSER